MSEWQVGGDYKMLIEQYTNLYFDELCLHNQNPSKMCGCP